jgi:hypothetical protein
MVFMVQRTKSGHFALQHSLAAFYNEAGLSTARYETNLYIQLRLIFAFKESAMLLHVSHTALPIEIYQN